MRKSSYRVLLFALVIGIFFMCNLALRHDSAVRSTLDQDPELEQPDPILETSTPEFKLTELTELDPDRVVSVNVNGTLVKMNLEDYVFDVVAAEMPASFAPEALKAQAIAARTYVIRKILSGGCSSMKGADVCSKSNHCQAFSTEEQRRSRWKGDYDTYTAKLRQAVDATAGEILTYNDEPILMLYHASSYGYTEDVEKVYSQALPYLRSVSSPEEAVDKVTTREEYSRAYFAKAVNAAYPKAGLQAAKLQTQVAVVSRYDSGRVKSVRVGSVTISGNDLRHVIEMRSTNFEFSFDNYSVVLTTRGYGHGVGMSQTGADVMAKEGSSYQDILFHYYTGVQLVNLNSLAALNTTATR